MPEKTKKTAKKYPNRIVDDPAMEEMIHRLFDASAAAKRCEVEMNTIRELLEVQLPDGVTEIGGLVADKGFLSTSRLNKKELDTWLASHPDTLRTAREQGAVYLGRTVTIRTGALGIDAELIAGQIREAMANASIEDLIWAYHSRKSIKADYDYVLKDIKKNARNVFIPGFNYIAPKKEGESDKAAPPSILVYRSEGERTSMELLRPLLPPEVLEDLKTPPVKCPYLFVETPMERSLRQDKIKSLKENPERENPEADMEMML